MSLTHFPTAFGLLGWDLSNGSKVRTIVWEQGWDENIDAAKTLDVRGTLIAITPPTVFISVHIPALFVCFERILSQCTQDALTRAWEGIVKAGIPARKTIPMEIGPRHPLFILEYRRTTPMSPE